MQVFNSFIMCNLVTVEAMVELDKELFDPVGAGRTADGRKLNLREMHMCIFRKMKAAYPDDNDEAIKVALEKAKAINTANNERQTFSGHIALWPADDMLLLEEKVCGAAGPRLSKQGEPVSALKIHSRIVRHIQDAHPRAEERTQAYQTALHAAQAPH
jgi:hypothetical protein